MLFLRRNFIVVILRRKYVDLVFPRKVLVNKTYIYDDFFSSLHFVANFVFYCSDFHKILMKMNSHEKNAEKEKLANNNQAPRRLELARLIYTS